MEKKVLLLVLSLPFINIKQHIDVFNIDREESPETNKS